MSPLQISVLVVVVLGARPFLAFALRWIDALVFWVQSIFIVCPHCCKTLKKLYFKCPGCRRVYTELHPNLLHVFHLSCPCGEKLATTRIGGRSNYVAYCPDCRRSIGKHGGEAQIVAFPIVGGPSSGKTAFLMSAIQVLTTTIADEKRWTPSFPYRADRAYAAKLRELFEAGIRPDKTNDPTPSAFCVDYAGRGLGESKRLCLYDPSGETFAQDWEKLQKQKYYNFMAGAIFVVDPFALPFLKDRIGERGAALADLNVCPVDQEICAERFFTRVDSDAARLAEDGEETFALYSKKELPCAVVVTKADALGLDRFIGEKAVRRFRENHPQYSDEEALDQVCRYWIARWGGANILNRLDAEFGVCRCFSVSALGARTSSNSGKFQPERIDLPMRWLLKEAGVEGRMSRRGVLIFLTCVVFAPLATLAVWVATLIF